MVLLMECQLLTVWKMSLSQQMQFPQVKHLGNKLCGHLLACAVSFVTVRGECTVGDRRSAVGDLLVDRSGVYSTVGDQSLVCGAKASVGGLWVCVWPAGDITSTPGVGWSTSVWGPDTQHCAQNTVMFGTQGTSVVKVVKLIRRKGSFWDCVTVLDV